MTKQETFTVGNLSGMKCVYSRISWASLVALFFNKNKIWRYLKLFGQWISYKHCREEEQNSKQVKYLFFQNINTDLYNVHLLQFLLLFQIQPVLRLIKYFSDLLVFVMLMWLWYCTFLLYNIIIIYIDNDKSVQICHQTGI